MLLPSLLRSRRIIIGSSEDDEALDEDPIDVFAAALSTIFTDDLTAQHGDEGSEVIYRTNGYGDLAFRLAELDASREGNETRGKFAHYVWNAGVLMGECVGGSKPSSKAYTNLAFEFEDSDWGSRSFDNDWNWWLCPTEELLWTVQNQRVVELGAGVGIGGIVSALAGASEVAITDYPSAAIHSAIQYNVERNCPSDLRDAITSHPHLWGDLNSTSFAREYKHHFTRVLAADTLWLAGQHENLARSMLHFLSVDDKDARVLVMAGFHTGRERLKHFFGETLDNVREGVERDGSLEGFSAHRSSVGTGYGDCLEVEDIFEMDANGSRRLWDWDASEDPIGERRKWVTLARLKRRRTGT